MQKQHGPGDKITMRNSLDGLYFLALCHSTCLSVFIRRDFGIEALGFNGFGAFLMLLLLWGADATGASMWFFWAWMAALSIQRLISVKNHNTGIITHSRYSGWPWFAMKFAKRESTAKRFVEPAMCLCAGMALMAISQMLGAFVLMGMLSLVMVEDCNRWIDKIRVQRMHDANIEMKRAAELYRGVDGY